MNKEQLFDAIDKIDDKYVSETENYDPETMKIRAFPFIHIMPAVLVTASAASVVLAVYLGSQIKPPGDYEIDNSVTESTTSVSEQYTSEVSDSVKPVTEPENVTDAAVSGSDGSSPADTGSSVTEVSAGASADPNVVIVSGNTAVSPKPSASPSGGTGPSGSPEVTQTERPTNTPTASATVKPTVTVSASPSPTATVRPTVTPTRSPQPTGSPETTTATSLPTATVRPTTTPTQAPTRSPQPTRTPGTMSPTASPTASGGPTMSPTKTASPTRTSAPTMNPTRTSAPTMNPTRTSVPTMSPTGTSAPTMAPTGTSAPTMSPTRSPHPTSQPTESRTGAPDPTSQPTHSGTYGPKPTMTPTSAPTMSPTGTSAPTSMPTGYYPTSAPTMGPTGAPVTSHPTGAPTMSPTDYPTGAPHGPSDQELRPTSAPVTDPVPEVILSNSASLKNFIRIINDRRYDNDGYSQNLHDAAEKISSEGFFYVPENDGFENSEVVMVSTADSVDAGLVYYANRGGYLCSIGVYSVDEDTFAQSENERAYIRNRYGEYEGNTYKLDSSNVRYNNEGAFFFIDDTHYCYIRSSLEDTELKKIINDLSFTKIDVD